MGLDPGWVTAVEIPRAAQLRALGNGVVPQQAEFAVRLMLDDLLRLGTRDDEAQAA
jgi:DNA (cytosine-5)-methyltransferase 1